MKRHEQDAQVLWDFLQQFEAPEKVLAQLHMNHLDLLADSFVEVWKELGTFMHIQIATPWLPIERNVTIYERYSLTGGRAVGQLLYYGVHLDDVTLEDSKGWTAYTRESATYSPVGHSLTLAQARLCVDQALLAQGWRLLS